MVFGKKKPDSSGLDVLTEIKEPFSFTNFYEEHIIGRIRTIKKFLEEKGILFFLLSPFQQRNRLICQIIIIVFGVLLGVIPRTQQLINQAKERNASSEMASLIDKKMEFSVGNLHIRPLASSQYDEQHLLAFLVTPESDDNIPSDVSAYEVNLSAARGVLDPENVEYSYTIIPVSETQWIFFVYTDNRHQEDTTGIYNLTIELSKDEIKPEDRQPLEVVLSDTQETNDLFNEKGINIAVLTEDVLGDVSNSIEEAENDLKDSLTDYELETQRIVKSPLNLSNVKPSVSDLEAFVKGNRIYPTLTDTSTTKDIVNLEKISDAVLSTSFTYPASIDMNGLSYSEEYKKLKEESRTVTDNSEEPSDTISDIWTDDEEQVFEELTALQSKVDVVLNDLSQLNSEAISKYERLKNYKSQLNQTITLDTFSKKTKVSPLME